MLILIIQEYPNSPEIFGNRSYCNAIRGNPFVSSRAEAFTVQNFNGVTKKANDLALEGKRGWCVGQKKRE